ncbi:MAG: hypothetical protein NTV21_12885 [Planctomycetota bacterium]|nr:hypothetical protein [Planctomycetota bacterium]
MEQVPVVEAAQPESAVEERISDEKRRELTDDQIFTGDSRRIEVGPQLAGVMRAGANWTVSVRAEDESGEPLEFASGSVSFLFVEVGSLTHVLRCDIERGLWNSALPIDGSQLVWFQFSSARLDGRRFVPSSRHDGFAPRFDGADLLVLEPAPETLVSVIDPRTSKLAKEAELLVSTKDDAELGYRFSFTVPFRGEPIRIDELRARDLEEVREVEVRASIVGAGEVNRTVELGSGKHYELRPLSTGSARVTWFPPQGFSARKAELVVHPVRLKIAVVSGSWEATRIQRLGASYFEGRDRNPMQELDDQPWTELLEGLPDGEYLAEITAELHVSSGRRTIGSANFSVASGTPAEVEIRTEPRAEDDWRLLAVELELPPGFEDSDVAASLVPVGFGARSFFNYMPVAAGRKRFATALVLRGRHEFRLTSPVPFATTFDVSELPRHVERVIVPPQDEYRIRVRVGDLGLALARLPLGLRWRTRTGTPLDRNEYRASVVPGASGEIFRILGPEAIEVAFDPSGPLLLAAGEWEVLKGGGEHELHVRSQPLLEVQVSAPESVGEPTVDAVPWVRRLEGGPWTRLAGFWGKNDAGSGRRFHGWLPFEGAFELELRCSEEFLVPPRQTGTLARDSLAKFEFELVRAK